MNQTRVVAFYLPQFFPTPYNDEWWGPGFTEWTNVARARPLYPGHEQPRLPGELGFYDLRLEETRVAQADLAREYGVHAFCYWHYWFGDGVRLLDRPFDEVLRSGVPDFPFCLGWANETWTGTWYGAPDRVLVEQRYPGIDDERRHFESLVPAFTDPRYVRVDEKPLFFVFRPDEVPDPRGFAHRWQQLARDAGLPGLFLVGRAHGDWKPSVHGFDGAERSQGVPPYTPREAHDAHSRRRLDRLLSAATTRVSVLPRVYSYRHWSPFIPELLPAPEESFPVVVPGWDNTPRAGRRGSVYHGSTPALFAEQVRIANELVRDKPADRRLIFLQSWNEWAEGNYLEPDRRWGRQYLEALRSGLRAGLGASDAD